MPHVFVNRHRRSALIGAAADERHALWEMLNGLLYLTGGVIFVAGSVLFLPIFDPWANLGAWLFVAGSLVYLIVIGHDLAEVCIVGTAARGKLEPWAAGCYLIGTLLFVVGSIAFLSWVDRIGLGAWCFVVGSLCFVAGAGLNVLQIVRASSLATLQLMNLTAISFVVGSVLFAVASVPYLFEFANAADHRLIETFAVAQFIVGSVLFVIGGAFSLRRAALVIESTRATADDPSAPAAGTD